jgi:hypothetical protein
VRSYDTKMVYIDSYECSVCKVGTRDLIFIPCEHYYMCYECYKKKINKDTCDKCNAKITSMVKVYVESVDL